MCYFDAVFGVFSQRRGQLHENIFIRLLIQLQKSFIARSAPSVRACLKSIAFVCLFLVRRINITFRPRKYRLAEATVGFGGPGIK